MFVENDHFQQLPPLPQTFEIQTTTLLLLKKTFPYDIVVLFIELKKLFMDVNIKINMNYTKHYVVRDYTLHNNA